MFKKIRNKIMLLNMLMVSSVVIAAFIVIFIFTYTQEHETRRSKLMIGAIPQAMSAGTAFRQEGAVYVEPGIDGSVVTGFARRIDPGEGLSFSLLVDGDGKLVEVNSVVNLPQTAYDLAALETAEQGGRVTTIELDGRVWQYAVSSVSVAFQSPDGEMQIAADGYNNVRFLDVTDSDRMLESLGLTLSALTVVILAAFFFISRFFANRAIRPMEEAFEKQSRFITDASHEIKTPLSIITADCGVLYANEDETIARHVKWVDSIMRAANRMDGLADSLLSLARLGDKEQELQIFPFDLGAAIETAVSDVERTILEKGLNIEKNIDVGIDIESDRQQLSKIISILLDNAIKYTDSGGNITVTLKKDKHNAMCAVRNSGDGIPPEDMPRVFDRFFRADPARSSENEGYGLGLAIAKAAAEKLGAELTVACETGQYTEFRLTLFRYNPRGTGEGV